VGDGKGQRVAFCLRLVVLRSCACHEDGSSYCLTCLVRPSGYLESRVAGIRI